MLIQQLHHNIWDSSSTNIVSLATPQESQTPALARASGTQGTRGADGMLRTELVAVPRAALGFLALGLSPDKAVAPSQSWLNDITQQNEKKKKIPCKW